MAIWLSALFAITGIFLLIGLGKSFYHVYNDGETSATFWFIGLAVVLPNAGALVSQFTGGRTIVETGISDFVPVLSGPAGFVNFISIPLLILSAAGFIIIQVRPRMIINSTGIIFVFLLIFSQLAGLLGGFSMFSGGRMGLLIPAIALLFAPKGQAGLQGAAHAGGLLVALSGILAAVFPEAAVQQCDDRKCGILGVLYVGVSYSFNSFGLLMALMIPVMYFGLRQYNMTFALVATFLTFASGSRTAQVAAAVTLLFLLWHRYAARRKGRAWARSATFASVVFLLLAGALPLLNIPPDSFTGRPALWNLALSSLTRSWLVGNGPEYWGSRLSVGEISNASVYSTHNQFVDVFLIGGVIGIVTFLALTAVIAVGSWGRLGELAILMMPILIVSSTERPWSIGVVDWLSWSTLLLIVTKFQVQNERNRDNLSEANRAGLGTPVTGSLLK